MDETQLKEDQKQFRKLRKMLRQIEHLELLTRQLNEEEEQKVARRDEYRLRLIELTSSYKGDELINLIDENAAATNQEGEEEVESTYKQVVEASNDDINELVEEFAKMGQHEIEVNNDEKKVKNPNEKKKKKKSMVSFDTFTKPMVHVDLITAVDINEDLIVTGSRDTTLKVWKFSETDESCELIQTLGGHRDSVTFVRFLASSTFQESLARLNETNNDDDDDLLIDQLSKWSKLIENNETDSDRNLPLVISSSLDSSFRLWSIGQLGFCLKEFYLYNPINHFDMRGAQLVFAMDAGKLALWNDFKSCYVSKAFQDSDRVVCVKFKESEFYSMSQNGLIKMFSIEEKSFKLVREIDLFERLDISIRRNFKKFELIENDQILVLNDNQPFVILFNISKETFQLISTNSSRYGLTTTFYKNGSSQLFLSSYSVDDGKSSLNVFEISDETLEYKYTLSNEASSSTNSISTLCGTFSQSSSSSTIVSCSSLSFTLWFIDQQQRRRRHRSEMKRMCELKIDSSDSSGDDDEENPKSEVTEIKERSEHEENSENTQQANRCSIQ